jgi:flagellar basal body-associated protein FliL
MTKVQFTRRNVIAIIIGLLVIIAISIGISTISFFINLQLLNSTPVEDYQTIYTQQPYLTYLWISRIITFLTPLLGGFVVGKIVKANGWLYGGILGLLLTILSIGFVLIVFNFSSNNINLPQLSSQQIHDMTQKNILSQILGVPFTIFLTGLGGFIGERIKTSKKKMK